MQEVGLLTTAEGEQEKQHQLTIAVFKCGKVIADRLLHGPQTARIENCWERFADTSAPALFCN